MAADARPPTGADGRCAATSSSRAAPASARELRVLAGCVWHIFRRRCGNGLLLTRPLGRPRGPGRWRERDPASSTPNASSLARAGSSRAGGRACAGGLRDCARRRRGAVGARAPRIDARPRGEPGLRDVLVLGVYAARPRRGDGAPLAELRREPPPLRSGWRRSRSRGPGASRRHPARAAARPRQVREPERPAGADRARAARAGCWWWTTTSSFRAASSTGSCSSPSACDLDLAQPALRHTSHAAWPHLRRARGSRRPSDADGRDRPADRIRAAAAAELLPFPPLKMGWGLDSHWARAGAASAAGGSGSSTRRRSATSRARRPPPTTAPRPWRNYGAICGVSLTLTAQRRHGCWSGTARSEIRGLSG